MSEYEIHFEELDRQKKKEYWDAAIGMQKVDNLNSSEYLLELAEKNIQGKLSYEELENLLYRRYEEETEEERKNRAKEGDMVAARIVQLLDGGEFPLQVSSLKAIHKELFKDLYDHAGQFRDCNIKKKEPILRGETVKYTDYRALEETLEYDFNIEKEKSYAGLNMQQIIRRIVRFTSSIWQVHPFREGNTRTTAVFIECYLNKIGFHVDNLAFKENSLYFRNALVRANFDDYKRGIVSSNEYLECFFMNLLTDKKVPLKNRTMIINEINHQREL